MSEAYQAGWNMAGELRDARASLRAANDMARQRSRALARMKLTEEEREAIEVAIRACKQNHKRESRILVRFLGRMA